MTAPTISRKSGRVRGQRMQEIMSHGLCPHVMIRNAGPACQEYQTTLAQSSMIGRKQPETSQNRRYYASPAEREGAECTDRYTMVHCTSAGLASSMGSGHHSSIRADCCRCTRARCGRFGRLSRANERRDSNRRHEPPRSMPTEQVASGRTAVVARCAVRRHRAPRAPLCARKAQSMCRPERRELAN